MRLLHTADWHLGRTLFRERLLDDQAHVLNNLVDLVRDTRPDAVIVAGDIYDRAVPPPEAVALLDDTLARLVLGEQVPVLLIAGNHDSPDRLGFGSRLFQAQRLHVAGAHVRPCSPVVLQDAHGPVNVHLLPYLEPPVARELLGQETIQDHDSAMRALVCDLGVDAAVRSILVAHAFVAGGAESESERALSVGGTGAVDAACLAPFDYVALGHLHRPQTLGHGRVQYAGSLLKYSFGEAADVKSCCLVEMDAAGLTRVERLPLAARRDVRCIRGRFEDLLAHPSAHGSPDDYLMVTLLDDGPVLDAKARLQAAFPHVLHVERAVADAREAVVAQGDLRETDPHTLFHAFWQDIVGEEITDAQDAALRAVLSRQQAVEREAVA